MKQQVRNVVQGIETATAVLNALSKAVLGGLLAFLTLWIIKATDFSLFGLAMGGLCAFGAFESLLEAGRDYCSIGDRRSENEQRYRASRMLHMPEHVQERRAQRKNGSL